ncbi:MAG: choice-of-anchor Q domain-containing protein, partial [Verrucomicrobiota bacterium]
AAGNASLSLFNLVIANGLAAGTNGTPGFDGGTGQGGGIWMNGGKLVLSGCRFFNNRAAGGTGGEYQSPIYRAGQGGTGQGGAIDLAGGLLSVTNCIFWNNSASGGAGGGSDTAPPAQAGDGGIGLGGAIHATNVSLAVVNCEFQTNQAQGGIPGTIAGNSAAAGAGFGGALQEGGGDSLVIGSLFASNNAVSPRPTGIHFGASNPGAGGAIFHMSGLISIDSSSFVSNAATGGNAVRYSTAGPGQGGAFCSADRAVITGSTFLANTARAGTGSDGSQVQEGQGGAVFNSGSLQISQCYFSLNSATGGSAYHGALDGGQGAAGKGGAIYSTSQLGVSSSTFEGNTTWGVPGGNANPASGYHASPSFGGALYLLGSGGVTNSTFLGNAAHGGDASYDEYDGADAFGGAVANAGTLFLENSTIASNSAVGGAHGTYGGWGTSTNGTGYGGGIFSTNGTCSLINTVLASNQPLNASAAITDLGHNLSSDSTPALSSPGSLNNTDPKLAPLADNGGATPTLALLAGSPAIDAADDSIFPPTDQRGLLRPVGSRADIGAFEYAEVLPGCSVTVDVTNINCDAAAQAQAVHVIANYYCDWTLASAVDWITPSQTNGSGYTQLTLSVATNASLVPRDGVVSMAGIPVTVHQAAASCSYALSLTNASFPVEGGTGSVQVAALPGCDWNASPGASWLHITDGTNGSGNGSVSYTVDANPDVLIRSAALSVGGQTLQIQQATLPACVYSVSSTNLDCDASAQSLQLTLSTSSHCGWFADSSPTAIWITPVQRSGTGSAQITLIIETNASIQPRQGVVLVGGQSVTVNQAGAACTYRLSSTNEVFDAEGGHAVIEVTALSGCSWNFVSSFDWITCSLPGPGAGSLQVGLYVSANPGAQARQGTVFLAGQAVTVTQAGLGCSYTLSSTNAGFLPAGGIGSFQVAALPDCDWTASSENPWLHFTSSTNGSGNGTINYSVDPFSGLNARVGTVSLAGQTVWVRQSGTDTTPPVLTVLSPARNVQVSSPTLLISGTASDRVGELDYIEYSMDGGASYDGRIEGTPAWSLLVTNLSPGTTFIRVRAIDRNGNVSAAPTIVVVRTPATDPAALLAGRYDGLFYDTNGMDASSAGFFSATVNTLGKMSGKLISQGKTYPLKGVIPTNGTWSASIFRGARSPIQLALQFDVASRDRVTGQVTDCNWTSELVANRNPYSSLTNPAFQAGNYTLVIPEGSGGNSYGAFQVDSAGRVKFKGKTGHGTAISQNTTLSGQGQWPFYASLQSGRELLIGWLTVSNRTAVNGTVDWIQLPIPRSAWYPDGFTNQSQALGSGYAYTPGVTLLDFNYGTATLENYLTVPGLRFASDNQLTDSNRFHLSITRGTGLFRGSAYDPATRRTLPFDGAILQNQVIGLGRFTGTNGNGNFSLSKFDNTITSSGDGSVRIILPPVEINLRVNP